MSKSNICGRFRCNNKVEKRCSNELTGRLLALWQYNSNQTIAVGVKSKFARLRFCRKKSNSMVSMEERLVTEAKQRRAASSGAAKKRNYQKKPGSKKNVCILSCIKPNNVLEEKEKFFNSGFEYNPQFSYDYHLAPSVRERFSKASSSYLAQVRVSALQRLQ